MQIRVEEVFVHPDRIPNPVGYRLLVEPMRAVAYSDQGIALPEQTIDAQQYLRYIGQVIAVGPECYDKRGTKWVQAGDWVAWHQHAGQVLRVRGQTAGGKDCIAYYLIINDDEVICEVPDPDAVLIPF